MKKLMLPFLAFLVFSSARAEDEKAAPPVEIKPKVVFKKSESHQFSGTHLKGQLKKPELSYIYERKGLKQEQIVNIPERFDDEIIEGAGKF